MSEGRVETEMADLKAETTCTMGVRHYPMHTFVAARASLHEAHWDRIAGLLDEATYLAVLRRLTDRLIEFHAEPDSHADWRGLNE